MSNRDNITNATFARWVNEYWQKRGLSANARLEKRTVTIPNRHSVVDGKKLTVPGYTIAVDIVVSDMKNGWPPGAEQMARNVRSFR